MSSEEKFDPRVTRLKRVNHDEWMPPQYDLGNEEEFNSEGDDDDREVAAITQSMHRLRTQHAQKAHPLLETIFFNLSAMKAEESLESRQRLVDRIDRIYAKASELPRGEFSIDAISDKWGGRTPMVYFFANQGNSEAVRWLCRNGADLRWTDDDGNNLMHHVAFNCDFWMMTSIARANPDVAKDILHTPNKFGATPAEILKASCRVRHIKVSAGQRSPDA